MIDNSSFAGNASGQKLDLAIVFDNTGSMQPEIDAMKSKVKELTDTIKASGLDASYSLVSFNDSVSVKTKWTKDQAIIKKNVDALYAEGGGDEPEDSMDAIEAVLSMGFRPDAQKIVLVITDAHAHYKNDSSGFSKYTKDEVEKDLRESGVTFIPISPTFEKQNGFVDLKEIANDIKSMWIDINSADFSTILEQFKGIITGTYVVEYTSPDQAAFGNRIVVVAVDVPGCVIGSDSSSYIKQVSAPISTEKKPNDTANENEGWNNSRLIESRLIEDNSILTFKGSIGRKDLQEKFVNVPNGTSKISANVSAEDRNGDIAFMLLDPEYKTVYAAVGSETEGSSDVVQPEPGKWRIWIHGNNVSAGSSESFSINVTLNGKQTAKDWNNKGSALADQGKYDEAIQAYDRAIELEPKNIDAWNNRGEAFHNQAKFDEAIRCFDKAIEIDPQYAAAWNNEGTVLDDQGKYNESISYFDKAISYFDKAIKLNPMLTARVFNNKGYAFQYLGNYDKAVQAYDDAIALDPNIKEAWNNKGYALYYQGKYDEAIQAFDKATEINPQYAAAWNGKGDALKALGRIAEADAAFAKAKELGYTG